MLMTALACIALMVVLLLLPALRAIASVFLCLLFVFFPTPSLPIVLLLAVLVLLFH